VGSKYHAQGFYIPWVAVVKIPWIGDQNTMGRGFDIPWVGVQNTMGGSKNTNGGGGGQNTMGRRFNIPLSMVFLPLLPMVYRTPVHDILIPLPMVF
jgi:hypothetical protein